MLSYRHGFHVGNHADILKHFVFRIIAQYLFNKDKSLLVVDTHAGAGIYNLQHDFAAKNKEYNNGLSCILDKYQQDEINNYKNTPPEIADFIDFIKSYNHNSFPINIYPGTAAIALSLMRGKEMADRLVLCELHQNESIALTQNMQELAKQKSEINFNRQIKIIQGDGFATLKALLPPVHKQALIIIDPSYEIKDDFAKTINCLQEAKKRFAVGTYVVWYPLLALGASQTFADKLKNLGLAKWLNVEILITNAFEKNSQKLGMFGSGLFVVNPPWTLPQSLEKNLVWLSAALAQDNKAKYHLNFLIP